MFIRMKSGREIGRVLDMRDEEARAMLADGRAIEVDFDDPKALETKVDFDLEDQQARLIPPLQVKTGAAGEPEISASTAEPINAEPRRSRRRS
jgi:hypothetical protein